MPWGSPGGFLLVSAPLGLLLAACEGSRGGAESAEKSQARRSPRLRVSLPSALVRVDSNETTAPIGPLISHSSRLPSLTADRKTAAAVAPSTSWVIHRRSSIHGRGVFARRVIPDGTRVLEYTGERITKPEAVRREAQRLERQRRGHDASVYVFVLNRRHDLDGRGGRSVARFINHSCVPNCRTEVIRGRIWIVARRDIAAGDELTYDYGFRFHEWRQHPCRCGAKRCAGFIVGKDQRWRLHRIPRAERKRHRVAG